jgi:hypothetical protein
MFYTWSIDPIVLDTAAVSHPCTKCGHSNQILSVYKKYIKVSLIVMIPLRKSCVVNCPHCGNSLNKKQFITELRELGGGEARRVEDQMHSLIANAKVPLHARIRFGAFLLLMALFGGFATYTEKQTATRVQEYHAQPHTNALLVLKHADEKFPYEIVFVKGIEGDNAQILASKYTYKRLGDATTSAKSIQKNLGTSQGFDEFLEPIDVKIDDLLACSIVEVLPN